MITIFSSNQFYVVSNAQRSLHKNGIFSFIVNNNKDVNYSSKKSSELLQLQVKKELASKAKEILELSS